MKRNSTCLLCLLNEKELLEFVGPIQSYEVDEVKQTYFEKEEIDQIQVIDECVFKALYYREYVENFHNNWDIHIHNFIESFNLESSELVIDESKKFEEKYESDCTIISIPTVGQITRASNDINLSIMLSAAPVLIGKFCAALSIYLPPTLSLVIDYEYISLNGEYYNGDAALAAYRIDKFHTINNN